MSKVVTWGDPKITSAKRAPGTYGSYRELLEKANAIRAEQESTEKYLEKAMPAMLALLEYKLRNQEPLVVMRPLRYQTSDLENNDQVDDKFYKGNSQSERVNDKYKEVIKTILPGTQLMLKSLDVALQEFVFVDARGTEHALNFAERNNLMTQTNVYEEARTFLEGKGE